MTTKTQSKMGKVMATMILAVMMVVLARPAAYAFGPISAIAGVANVVAGSQLGNPGPVNAEADVERKSLAEAMLGIESDGSAESLVDIARRGSILRIDAGPRS